MQTLLHTAAFERAAAKLMSDEELAGALDVIARNPESGDVVKGTGGVRKIRVALPGRGKSGGARVIYYYFDDNNPVYLFMIYAKNVRTDLTDAQCNELRRAVAAIKGEFRSRRTR
ncbi:MAG: type II toxin-antitoxin system RelE/ParE family toxin [Dongiaceae bacterium]